MTGTPRVKVCSSSKPDTLIPSETMARTQSVSAELSDRKTKRPAVYPSLSLSAYPLVCMLLSDDMPKQMLSQAFSGFPFSRKSSLLHEKSSVHNNIVAMPPAIQLGFFLMYLHLFCFIFVGQRQYAPAVSECKGTFNPLHPVGLHLYG